MDYAAVDGLCAAIAAQSKSQAARVLAIMSKACNLAVRWQWLERNPCQGVVKARVEARERYLSPAELKRLTVALDKLAEVPA